MVAFSTDTIALKKLMIDNGIETITDLSEKSDVNRNTLTKVLSGKAQPSADVMQKLIIALGIEPSTAGAIFFVPNLRDV